MIDDFFRKISRMQIFLKVIVFFGFLYYHFFRKLHKRKIKQKSVVKQHFYLIDDNFLKKKALDRFSFAWGGAKGFFFEKA